MRAEGMATRTRKRLGPPRGARRPPGSSAGSPTRWHPGARFACAVLVAAVAASCGPAGEGAESGNAQPARSEVSSSARTGAEQTPPRGMAWVIFGADTVEAEIARTAEERQEGLMFREELPPGTGMLFVFDDVTTRSFWMKNTYLPLSIAFLDENQRIVDIQHMEPEDENFTRSAAPAIFALEVIQGWFEEQGISVGDQAEIVFGPG